MATTLDELVAKVITSISQDAYNAEDIRSLVEISLHQRSTIERLADDVERLTDSVAQAGKRLAEMEQNVDAHTPPRAEETVDPTSIYHLIQYAEESSPHDVG